LIAVAVYIRDDRHYIAIGAMMKLIPITFALSISIGTMFAAAEPIVVHQSSGTLSPELFNISDIDPVHPDLSFALDMETLGSGVFDTNFRPIVIENGTECFGAFPGNLFPEVADIGFLNITAGTTVDAGTGGWVYTEPLCDVGSVLDIVQKVTPGDFICEPGCVFEESTFANAGVIYIPFRWREDGESDWYYGWSAFEVTEQYVGECTFTCAPDMSRSMYDVEFRWLAVGYETEPNTGIVTGGGLCRADLNFSGSLNFLDVSDFLSKYGSGDLAADFSGDGNLNFLDVSEFLGLYGDCDY
jgi:hypothetical protein